MLEKYLLIINRLPRSALSTSVGRLRIFVNKKGCEIPSVKEMIN